jgi:hypothetical protein
MGIVSHKVFLLRLELAGASPKILPPNSVKIFISDAREYFSRPISIRYFRCTIF